MEIYIRINKDNIVEFVHTMPFDPVNGLGKSREELLKSGLFIESIPEPENREGMVSTLKYNPANNTVYYEYTSAPMTESERLDMLESAFNDLLMR